MRETFLTLLLLCSASAAAAEVTGNWITEDRSAVIAIQRCGPSLCGNVAKILIVKPNYPQTDVHNPDPRLRSKPILGLRILSGFSSKGDRWENGRIYDPKSGKSYKSKLSLNRDGSLSVSGCIAFICQTQRWSRAR